VHVLALAKRVDEHRVLGKVRQHTEFDLRVVAADDESNVF
jgi:hypothetical protein